MAHVQRNDTRSARIHDQLGHPVIDADGHIVEPLPLLADFVRDHGRHDIADAVPLFHMDEAFWRARREASAAERRRQRMVPTFWGTPGDTEYFATVSAPSRYYERLGDAGIDFAVLYPTWALDINHLIDEEHRVSMCRLYNEFIAELYGPYSDRLTVAALIPMGSPEEAIDCLIHATTLGAKVALIPNYVRRLPEPPRETWALQGPAELSVNGWIDTYGLESMYDYDPVWAKAIELGLPLAAHSSTMGFEERSSVSNFMFNQIGHFAAAGEMLAKSLFFGGVTRRFPRLRIALLEGGVAVGVSLYIALVSRWHKRGGPFIQRLNPGNLNRRALSEMLAASDARFARYPIEELIERCSGPGGPDDWTDDFADADVNSEEDICDRFCQNFYWGCEADDPLVGLAFDHRYTPLGARVPPVMGSDIGHWDVPEFDSPVAEAYELVERRLLDEEAFREFVFSNAVRLYGSLNPQFFGGTHIEEETAQVPDDSWV